MEEVREAVLELLKRKGPLAFFEIAKALSKSNGIIGLALGYLLCEGKVKGGSSGYRWESVPS